MSKFATIGVAGAPGPGASRSPTRPRRPAARSRSGAATPRRCASSGAHADGPRLPGVALAPAAARRQRNRRARRCEAILLVVPAQATREAAARLAERFAPRPLIVCAKGIERGSQRFMTEVVAEAAPGWPAAILSGPSFAADVAGGPADRGDAGERRRSAGARAVGGAAGGRTCGSITRPTCAASRSAARPRTCSRSPAASRRGSASAPAPARR